eukprot:357554-Chlamydomonas_euryale.AAC.18
MYPKSLTLTHYGIYLLRNDLCNTSHFEPVARASRTCCVSTYHALVHCAITSRNGLRLSVGPMNKSSWYSRRVQCVAHDHACIASTFMSCAMAGPHLAPPPCTFSDIP